jgi:hypothetical protein
VPTAPEGLGPHAKAAWERFWCSPISQIVDLKAHGEALRHWVRCLDAREALWSMWRTRPLIKGSHGQFMTNPLWRQIRDLDDEIAHAEEVFGMNPLAQMRLGIGFLAGQSMMQSPNQQAPSTEVADSPHLWELTQHSGCRRNTDDPETPDEPQN